MNCKGVFNFLTLNNVELSHLIQINHAPTNSGDLLNNNSLKFFKIFVAILKF